jgi:phospho-N-acetylmuramoyl-pentapeptide-transferase
MGDTGSLSIGGIIAVIAILIHKEILLVLLCGVFVAENLSVMAQVAYYKSGKRKGIKQRLFRRAPLHHHYNIGEEKLDKECTYLFKGPERPLHEAKITLRFWIVTIVMAVITLMTLKIR